MLDWLKKNRFLVFLLLLTGILRLPSLFEPYWYGDENLYLTLGLGLRKGLLLYKEIYDNKTPLIYVLAFFANNLFQFKFLLLVVCLGSVILFNKLVRIFLHKSNRAAKISLLVFTLLLNLPLFESNIVNAEILQIFPTLLAILLIFGKKNPKKMEFFLAGVFFSVSFLTKVPGVFDLVAVALYLTFFETKFCRQRLLNLFWLGSGFIIPIIVLILFYWQHHYLKELLGITIFQNLGYLSSWKTGSHQVSFLKSGFVTKGGLLLLLTLAVFLFRKSLSSPTRFLFIWTLFALFAALLSNRPYPHYLLQTLAPFSLIIGVALKEAKASRWLALLLLALFYCVFVSFHFWTYPTFSYYQNFLLFVTHNKSTGDYFNFFGPMTDEIYQVSAYVKETTLKNDPLFVWSDNPQIYFLSQRIPASRFVAAYHILDFNKSEEVGKNLLLSRPPLVVMETGKKDKLPPYLASLIFAKYIKVKATDHFEIYRLIKDFSYKKMLLKNIN